MNMPLTVDAPTVPPDHAAIDPNRQVAIRLAKAGLRVFPAIVTFNPITGRWDKKPSITGWQEKAAIDLPQIEKWWDQWPEAVPGIELRSADLVVLDPDRHGGPDGVALLEDLARPYGGIPRSPVTLTAGGGKHFIFRQPAGEKFGNSRGSLPDGIDVRGNGGWIVAPGAIRSDGAIWQPEPGMPTLESAYAGGEIPILPEWLAESIGRRPEKDKPRDYEKYTGTTDERGRAFAGKALIECAAELASTKAPGRNNRLNAVAYRMGRMIERGWIEPGDVSDALWLACEKNGLVADDGADSVQATLGSGIEDGRKNPHPDLDDRPVEDDRKREAGNEEIGVLPGVWDGDELFVPPEYLVRDLIRRFGLTLLAGESQAAKTFLALDLAVCVALGESFFRRETKRGGVLYVAAEGEDTIPERLEALRLGFAAPIMAERKQRGESTFEVTKLAIFTAKECPNLLLPANEAQLINTLQKANKESLERFDMPVSLVIIDTIISAFAISDWNSAGSTMGAMKVLQRIVDRGVAVVALAHHGKDPGRGTAGSFALTAAPDSVIAASRDTNPDGSVRA